VTPTYFYRSEDLVSPFPTTCFCVLQRTRSTILVFTDPFDVPQPFRSSRPSMPGVRRKLFPDVGDPAFAAATKTSTMPVSQQSSCHLTLPIGMVDDHEDDDDDDGEKKTQPRRNFSLKCIQWMESLVLPPCCVKLLPAALRVRNNNDGDNHNVGVVVPIITGLERTLYGTQPAAEVVRILGIRPPRYLCYMISGLVCDILQFFLDFLLYSYVTLDASACWALSFGISIFFRHTTHRYLVFGDYVGGYYKSLGRMYAGYSFIIVLSTMFNIVMTKYSQVPHSYAWVITMLWTGIVNYFILKKLWSFGGTGGENAVTTNK
jgi:putative flippase GtrA